MDGLTALMTCLVCGGALETPDGTANVAPRRATIDTRCSVCEVAHTVTVTLLLRLR
jgi:hypothetical protein